MTVWSLEGSLPLFGACIVGARWADQRDVVSLLVLMEQNRSVYMFVSGSHLHYG
jgi:hypothetical protein